MSKKRNKRKRKIVKGKNRRMSFFLIKSRVPGIVAIVGIRCPSGKRAWGDFLAPAARDASDQSG